MAWGFKKPTQSENDKTSRRTKATKKAKDETFEKRAGDAVEKPKEKKAPGDKLPVGHRLANIFPMMDDDAIDALARDIKENGLREKIVRYEGQVLDGRCRERACRIAGVEPRYKEYSGDDPLAFVISRNLHRRHLNDSQRALVAARLADLKLGANQHNAEGVPIGTASKSLNVSKRSTARGKEVVRDGIPELVEAVESGKVPISAAAKISQLPKSEQRPALAGMANPARKRSAKPKISKSKGLTKSGSSSALADECLTSLTPLDPRKPKAYFAAIKDVWVNTGLAAAWADAPQEVRERFIADVLS
jgi:hypothetical protein